MEPAMLYLDDPSATLESRNEIELKFSFSPSWTIDRLLALLLERSPQKGIGGELVGMEYIDGPPNPQIDEGFQLFRLTSDAIDALAAIPSAMVPDIACRWRASLEEYLRSIGEVPEDLEGLVSRASEMAREGKRTGKAMFVRVLYR